MPGKIAVVGSTMVDLITYVVRMPGKGETIEAPNFEMGHGGKGANQATAAAKLGSEVTMVTKVGDDIFADTIIRNFQSHGVDTRFVRKAPGMPSGVAPIFVEPNGENSILIIKGANTTLSPSAVDDAAEALKTCNLILMQLEVPLETVYHTVAFGTRHGIPTLLNPAPAVADLDASRLRDLTFLTPNETELATLSGLPVDTGEQVRTAARALIAKGIKTVIVTMGGRGALLVTGEHVTPIPPIRVVPRDTTGAGDAFIGSFAHYYVEKSDIAAALNMAVRYAADSITRNGTQKSYATRAEFEAFCISIG